MWGASTRPPAVPAWAPPQAWTPPEVPAWTPPPPRSAAPVPDAPLPAVPVPVAPAPAAPVPEPVAVAPHPVVREEPVQPSPRPPERHWAPDPALAPEPARPRDEARGTGWPGPIPAAGPARAVLTRARRQAEPAPARGAAADEAGGAGVRFTRTPDHVLRMRQLRREQAAREREEAEAAAVAAEAARLAAEAAAAEALRLEAEAAAAAAAVPPVPLWRQPYVLPPGVRFTRTPDHLLRHPAETPTPGDGPSAPDPASADAPFASDTLSDRLDAPAGADESAAEPAVGQAGVATDPVAGIADDLAVTPADAAAPSCEVAASPVDGSVSPGAVGLPDAGSDAAAADAVLAAMPVDAVAAGPLPSPDEAGAMPLAADDGAGARADAASPDEAHGSESELRAAYGLDRLLRHDWTRPLPIAEIQDNDPEAPRPEGDPDAPATVVTHEAETSPAAVVAGEPDALSALSADLVAADDALASPVPAELALSTGPVPGFASASFGLSLPLPVPPQAPGDAAAAGAPDVIPLPAPEPLLALTYAPLPRVPEALWPTAPVIDPAPVAAPVAAESLHLPVAAGAVSAAPVAGFDLSPLECFVPGDDFVLSTEGFALPPLGWADLAPDDGAAVGTEAGPRAPEPLVAPVATARPFVYVPTGRGAAPAPVPNPNPRPPRIILPVGQAQPVPVGQAQPVPVGQAQPVPVEPVQPVPAERADSRPDETAYPVPTVPSLAEEPAWIPAADDAPAFEAAAPSPEPAPAWSDESPVPMIGGSGFDIDLGLDLDDPEDDDDILAPVPSEAPALRLLPSRAPDAPYALPPLTLLAEPRLSDGSELDTDLLERNAVDLQQVIQDFGVRGEILAVRPGPVVTLYEMEPAPGTKSSRVISLADDIARSMSAVSARVAVVQGRNAIGIELPNAKRETVYLRELLASPVFAETKQKLALCLGKNIGGEPIIADLARMPHLLVAGTTGSGKSVAINTMILSLLYRLKPEECRLIMVDPKMLELSVYDGIPHLLSPVVTDPKKAVIALKWAVREMEERYKKMSKLGVRNIDGFNARVAEARARGEVITRTVQTGFDRETGEAVYEDEVMDLSALPYIVIIVDEMADLMMVAGKDIEGAIQRLAQMARAAGLHLIMATQRPSVDVITGTIKANFPTRISFQVTSKIDSRTILGEMGAEQLLGQGDMLFMAGGGRTTRVHGPFCSDDEVEQVVAHLKRQGRPSYLDSITVDEEAEAEAAAEAPVFDGGNFAEPAADVYDQAVAVVLRDKKASTSYIQRRLQIGYNRAASLMERMEREGIVGPANHAGKREILVEATAPPADEG
ncbi:DNA translocase FtsK [uncultured Methylobacterium sp.]|uniref:DNA translocase FtsK n=1 Tax=uncultured Methylobacterium sp. TaxID=157278 RepID=UPI00260646FD|nr:DNA translocase FtsK [uncultured Methylobacterium sp.]